jgi:hypothetical protein
LHNDIDYRTINMSQQGDPDFPNAETATDNRPDAQKQAEKQLANRLSTIIENANERVIPICKMIRRVRQSSSSYLTLSDESYL